MQDIFFDGWGNIVSILICAPLLYLAVIGFIRLSGKRSTSQMNNFDWIVTVAMGSLVASCLVLEDVTLVEALFAIGALMALQYVFTFGAARLEWVEQLIKSKPAMLYNNGYCSDAMSAERITESEVTAAIRENGFASLDQVRWIILESDASFSVVAKGDPSSPGHAGLIGIPSSERDRDG